MSALLDWIEAHPGMAAWMQAIGSVGVLLIAIAIPIWERRRIEQAAALAIMEPLENCLSTIHMPTLASEVEQRYDLKLNVQALRGGPIDRLSPALNFRVRNLVNALQTLSETRESDKAVELAAIKSGAPPMPLVFTDLVRRQLIDRVVRELEAISRLNSKLVTKQRIDTLKVMLRLGAQGEGVAAGDSPRWQRL